MTVDVSESQTQLSETNKLLNFWTELPDRSIEQCKQKEAFLTTIKNISIWTNLVMMNLNCNFWICWLKLTTFKLFINNQRFISLFITVCTLSTLRKKTIGPVGPSTLALYKVLFQWASEIQESNSKFIKKRSDLFSKFGNQKVRLLVYLIPHEIKLLYSTSFESSQ